MPLRVPKRYSDCEPGGFNALRPCEFVCKHLLSNGECTLDHANDGRHTLAEVAEIMGEKIGTIEKVEARALAKLKRSNLLRVLYES